MVRFESAHPCLQGESLESDDTRLHVSHNRRRHHRSLHGPPHLTVALAPNLIMQRIFAERPGDFPDTTRRAPTAADENRCRLLNWRRWTCRRRTRAVIVKLGVLLPGSADLSPRRPLSASFP